MKVMQINCVYNKGSTGKIMYDIHNGLLENGIESVICYGRGAGTTDKNVYKTCSELYAKLNNLLSRITGLMYGGCFFSTNKLISIIKKEKPDVVHLHCINGYFVNIYRLVSWLKKSKIKTVLTLHAEFMHTANCGYALDCERWKIGCGGCPRLREETKSWLFDGTHKSFVKMQRAFEGFENLTVVSVSPWLMERAEQSPILKGKRHTVILNGLNTDIFRIYDTSELRKKHGINEDEKVVFHATANFTKDPNHIKGGYYVLELAKALPHVRFIVAGSYDRSISFPSNMIMLGRINDTKELAKYYSMADLTVIASKKETFSMICAESLCCGTPIVGFVSGGPERIFDTNFSKFIERGEVADLHSTALEFLNRTFDKQEISEDAMKKYSKARMIEEYRKIYNS